MMAEPAAATAPCADMTAIVVTYHPAPDALERLVQRLRGEVGRIVIVDNESAGLVERQLRPYADLVEVAANAENLGVATAQNQGIARALARDECRFLLFLDEDSLPEPGMAGRLRAALRAGPAPDGSGGRAQAAAAPSIVDERTQQRSWVVVERGGRPARAMPPDDEGAAPICASFLVASGTVVPREVLLELQGMRGRYFIDHVDTEWCLRARAAGYRLLVVPQARLRHRLGDSVRRVWFLGWRQVAYHTPLRDYYMFRNTLLMLRDVPMPLAWRAHFVLRLVKFAAYFLAFAGQRRARLSFMALGLRHGLAGVSGRLDAASRRCTALPPTPYDPR
jgi:rhamnosyltransferase